MTFEQSYDILNNKLGLLVDVSKPLAPQLKQARIDRMQGKTEEPDVLKYAEADRKILAEMRRALREGKPRLLRLRPSCASTGRRRSCPCRRLACRALAGRGAC